MIINFSKKQIIKETPNGAIIVEIGEYKLSIQKRFIKNNTFIIDENRIYWVFKNDIKKELTGDELKKLLFPYIKINNEEKTPNKTIIQLLKPLSFYEEYNAWYIGNINGNDCFKYNITWKDENSYNNEILKINESR